jgi:hypothetical protein
MPTRRSLIVGSAAAAASPFAAAAGIPNPPPLRAHWVAGGAGGIVAARFGVSATGSYNGVGTVKLPLVDKPCLLPLGAVQFDESGGTLFTLANQQVQVLQTGRYRMTLSVNWGPKAFNDIDLREYGIQRLQAGDAPLVVAPLPKVTNLGTDKYDRLACYDVPGSDSTANARSAVGLQWDPGTVPPGDYVYADVALSPTGVINPGDAAQVGLSTLTSALLGSAADRLRLVGRVDAPDLVRVVLQNLGADPVTVPPGLLNVLGQSLTIYRGGSANAWLTVQTADEVLYAGEQIFCFFRSKTSGDFVQVTNESFLQIEKLG